MTRAQPFLMLTTLLWWFAVPTAQALTNEEQKLQSATQILGAIQAIPEKSVPPALLRSAQGIAVIPSVIKAGLMVGGRYGEGVLVVRGDDGEWGNPAFISFKGGSVGWQLGVQSTDVILVFKDRDGVAGITSGTFTLGADVGVAAGPVGRQATASTDTQLKASIYSYSRSRGFFAGVSLDGTSIAIDHNANNAFYGREYAAADILAGKPRRVPDAARLFTDAVTNAETGSAR